MADTRRAGRAVVEGAVGTAPEVLAAIPRDRRDPESTDRPKVLLFENSPQGSNLAQWAGSNSLVTGLCCGLSERVRAWALPARREIRTIDFGMPRWWQVGGNRLLTSHLRSEAGGGQFMHLKSWRLSEGTEHDLRSIECTELGTCSGLFTPDGGTYLYGKGDSVFLRQLPLGESVDRVLSRLGSNLSAFRFPSFRKFWARDADGLIRAWTFEGSTFENPVDISKPETAAAIVDLDASGRWGFRAGGNHQDAQVAGHVGSLTTVAVSPDLKWVASTGEDNTLRLWPMPDPSKPPLHTLPHDELIAKLKSLTNLRAVRDPEAEGGWKIDLAPFPGWKDVPTW